MEWDLIKGILYYIIALILCWRSFNNTYKTEQHGEINNCSHHKWVVVLTILMGFSILLIPFTLKNGYTAISGEMSIALILLVVLSYASYLIAYLLIYKYIFKRSHSLWVLCMWIVGIEASMPLFMFFDTFLPSTYAESLFSFADLPEILSCILMIILWVKSKKQFGKDVNIFTLLSWVMPILLYLSIYALEALIHSIEIKDISFICLWIVGCLSIPLISGYWILSGKGVVGYICDKNEYCDEYDENLLNSNSVNTEKENDSFCHQYDENDEPAVRKSKVSIYVWWIACFVLLVMVCLVGKYIYDKTKVTRYDKLNYENTEDGILPLTCDEFLQVVGKKDLKIEDPLYVKELLRGLRESENATYYGTIDDSNICLILTIEWDGTVTGKYAYDSVIEKYGNEESSWFSLEGNVLTNSDEDDYKNYILLKSYNENELVEYILLEYAPWDRWKGIVMDVYNQEGDYRKIAVSLEEDI